MKKLICIFLVSVFPQLLLARQVSVVASVDQTTIGTEETLTYTIEIRGANPRSIQTPSPPETEGLNLLQSVPGTQSNVSIVNGVVTQTYGFRWSYRALKEGNARFGEALVRVADTTYQTASISITVVPQSQRPARTTSRAGRRVDPFSSLFRPPTIEEPSEVEPDSQDIFIRAIPSTQSVVQNEQVTIEYLLFFREGIQLRQSRLTDSWDAEGFWREELDVDTRPIPQIVVEKGLRYNKIVLKRAAVFPTHAGLLTVDPLRIESEAVLPNRSNDPFQAFFSLRSRFKPVELSSPAVSINARPWPADPPWSFTGAVGRYQMTTRVDRTNLEVGESLQMVVTISGTGNLATLDSPVFMPPAAFELYDPQIETNLNRSGRSLSGSKSFTFVMVPRSNGSFEFPVIEFTYLNPSTGRYVTEQSDPLSIRVTGSASSPITIATTANGLPVDDVAPPIIQAGRWVSIAPLALHEQTWPYLALFLPLLLLGAVYVIQKHQTRIAADVTFARGRRAHPLARKHLKVAWQLMVSGETSAFFEEIERAVLGFIGNRLNVAERGLTRTQLDEVLEEAKLDIAVRQRLQLLMDTCDRGRFAPSSIAPTDLKDAYEEAGGLIVLLSTALNGST